MTKHLLAAFAAWLVTCIIGIGIFWVIGGALKKAPEDPVRTVFAITNVTSNVEASLQSQILSQQKLIEKLAQGMESQQSLLNAQQELLLKAINEYREIAQHHDRHLSHIDASIVALEAATNK